MKVNHRRGETKSMVWRRSHSRAYFHTRSFSHYNSWRKKQTNKKMRYLDKRLVREEEALFPVRKKNIKWDW